MVLCILAFIVFAILSIFSAKYRPLAKESFRCVFRTLMLKPCDTGLDDRIKAEVVSGVMKLSPGFAKVVNRYFAVFSWAFVILTIASFAYMIYGAYNFYYYGNCDGPTSVGACILNDLTGDYGRFSDPKDLIPPTNFEGITYGNPDAKVKIVEFGCFTCPYTKKAEPMVEQLLEESNESIYYVFKPFPLPNHKNSYDIAHSVLCAKKQEKEWDLRKRVFVNQEACALDGEVAVKDIAKDAGLDMEKFNKCMDGKEAKEELDSYIQQGKDSHIYATPTFFVNGKPIVGPKPIEEFKKAIEEAGG